LAMSVPNIDEFHGVNMTSIREDTENSFENAPSQSPNADLREDAARATPRSPRRGVSPRKALPLPPQRVRVCGVCMCGVCERERMGVCVCV
jgi:hypothetical protein